MQSSAESGGEADHDRPQSSGHLQAGPQDSKSLLRPDSRSAGVDSNTSPARDSGPRAGPPAPSVNREHPGSPATDTTGLGGSEDSDNATARRVIYVNARAGRITIMPSPGSPDRCTDEDLSSYLEGRSQEIFP